MSAKRDVSIAVAVIVLGVVAARSLVLRMTPERPPKPVLRWKCTACGDAFQAELAGSDAEVRSDLPAVPKAKCPQCSGEARRLIHYRCSDCSQEFDHLLVPAADGKEPSVACPHCQSSLATPAEPAPAR